MTRHGRWFVLSPLARQRAERSQNERRPISCGRQGGQPLIRNSFKTQKRAGSASEDINKSRVESSSLALRVRFRSRWTDDIACWFIDSNDDGESFFFRHAYFTGD